MLNAFDTRIVSGSKLQSKGIGASSRLNVMNMAHYLQGGGVRVASDCRFVKNFKTERTNDSDKLIIYGPFRSQLSLILEILAITLRKLGLVAALRLSPIGRG